MEIIMNREQLQVAILGIAKNAQTSEEYAIATVLFALVGAILNHDERILSAGVMQIVDTILAPRAGAKIAMMN